MEPIEPTFMSRELTTTAKNPGLMSVTKYIPTTIGKTILENLLKLFCCFLTFFVYLF